jgi:hypothetical protein
LVGIESVGVAGFGGARRWRAMGNRRALKKKCSGRMEAPCML